MMNKKEDKRNYVDMEMLISEILDQKLEEKNNLFLKRFVRYEEGAKRYSMSPHSFMRYANDAGAVCRVNRISLVDTEIFESYLETFRDY